MIKKKGSLIIRDEGPQMQEFLNDADRLPNGEYHYLIYDNNKNRNLPQLKYLMGGVLKSISDNLDDHPAIGALYRYFEKLYAPKHSCIINGKEFVYSDLKSEKTTEMNNSIEKIVHHASTRWGIKVPSMEDMKVPEEKEAYVGAYTDDWSNYNFKK